MACDVKLVVGIAFIQDVLALRPRPKRRLYPGWSHWDHGTSSGSLGLDPIPQDLCPMGLHPLPLRNLRWASHTTP